MYRWDSLLKEIVLKKEHDKQGFKTQSNGKVKKENKTSKGRKTCQIWKAHQCRRINN